MTGTRPEHTAPPEFYYNANEARKYLSNSHLVETQTRLAQRALELASPVSPPGTPGEPLLFLDVGCGTGLSGDVLTDAGHHWVGVDVSEFMLAVAVERDVDGDAVQLDIGAGLPFRIGVFDGAISVSALQWLCNADRTEHEPRRRLRQFFTTLYASLRKGARAALQFYPSGEAQIGMILEQARVAGFSGGLLVDYPHSTRAKKFYLALRAGPPEPGDGSLQPLEEDTEGSVAVDFQRRQQRRRRNRAGATHSAREYIERKKQRQARQGKAVRPPSKYSGRRRSGRAF